MLPAAKVLRLAGAQGVPRGRGGGVLHPACDMAISNSFWKAREQRAYSTARTRAGGKATSTKEQNEEGTGSGGRGSFLCRTCWVTRIQLVYK